MAFLLADVERLRRVYNRRGQRPEKRTSVDEILIPGREDDRNLVKQFAAHYDAPAYV